MMKLCVSMLSLAVLFGCAPAIVVIEPISRTSRIAIVQFADCTEILATDCGGSGKIASDAYSGVFGAPILATENDPSAKSFDLLILGKVLNYNNGIPLVGRYNYAQIDFAVKRISDGKIVATQQLRKDTYPGLGKSTPEIVRWMAEDLRTKLGI